MVLSQVVALLKGFLNKALSTRTTCTTYIR
jgi:hypothetical protein